MWDIVVIACRVDHSATGIGFIIDEFVSWVIVSHDGVEIVLLYPIVIPYLEYAQGYSRAEFMVFGQRPI